MKDWSGHDTLTGRPAFVVDPHWYPSGERGIHLRQWERVGVYYPQDPVSLGLVSHDTPHRVRTLYDTPVSSTLSTPPNPIHLLVDTLPDVRPLGSRPLLLL